MSQWQLTLRTDITRVERAMKQDARQLPFVIAKAINDSMVDAQDAQRKHMNRIFTVRNRRFVRNSVKIKPFATRRTMRGQMLIDPPGGQARADILTKFEDETIKTPFQGEHMAIPIEARRTGKGIVRKSDRIRSFNFRRKGRAIVGDKRTYIVPGVGVFQRVGRRGSTRTKLLYTFKRQVPIKANLNFIENIEGTVTRVFDRHFHQWALRVLNTAGSN